MKLSATAVLTVFLLSSCTQQVSSRNKENSPNTQTVKKETTMEQVRNRCRRMLHKVESRDDLIKQMYETAFKDDCLYVMHAEELKEIWKIPVTDSYPEMPKYLDIESPIGMYVVIEHTSYKTNIYISMTKKYREKKGSIFPENNFPAFLPVPKEDEMPDSYYTDTIFVDRKESDSIKERFHYYWRENGREIIATNSGTGAILALSFYSNLEMSPMN
ncbi:TPA: hypothetical protein ACQWMG_001800 [Neisseria subflava]|jgi:hypothetical protein|uniref:hypothetical protein n=1 Tax=Neisseria TaxID=482 RepID=UPI000D2FD191|nr:hypothetical protein [Neisseria subflava]